MKKVQTLSGLTGQYDILRNAVAGNEGNVNWVGGE